MHEVNKSGIKRKNRLVKRIRIILLRNVLKTLYYLFITSILNCLVVVDREVFLGNTDVFRKVTVQLQVQCLFKKFTGDVSACCWAVKFEELTQIIGP